RRVLFRSLSVENQSELTATIDACNKSNVAIYAVDARGLVTTAPAGSSRNRAVSSKARAVAASFRTPAPRSSSRVRLVLAAYPAMGMPDPQRPGGGGGGPPSGGGGGRPGGGGGAGGPSGGGGAGGRGGRWEG